MYTDDTRQLRRLPDPDTSLPRLLRRGRPTRSAEASTAATTPRSYHVQQGVKGFLSGLVVVVPAVLWMSGTLSKPTFEIATVRPPTVVISSVAVRPLSTTEPLAVAPAVSSIPSGETAARAEPAAAAGTALDRSGVADRLIDAHTLIRDGHIERARELLSDATVASNPEAAYLLAETYDPNLLAALGITSVNADAHKARELYSRALGGGITTARQRLQSLH